MSKPIMSAVTIPRTLATGFVIMAIAAVLVMGGRRSGDEPLQPPQLATPTEAEPPALATAAPAFAVSGTPADVKMRELIAMSETYRNTTFLIAIRDAGFLCRELLRVYGALDDAPKWVASCSEMLSYTVGVASDGTLHVEPMLQYFDGVAPAVQPNGEPALPPQQPRPLQPRR